MFLFKGIFNYKGEVNTLYTHTKCKDKAWFNFCHQLSKKYGVSKRVIYCHFDGSIDNYKITNEGRK